MGQMIEKDGLFYLEGVKTPKKNLVFSENKKLIERIVETSNGKFKAKDFGLFSMYCTFRDLFSQPDFERTDTIKEMLQNDKMAAIMTQFDADYIYDHLFDEIVLKNSLEALSAENAIPINLLRGGDLDALLPYVKKELDLVSPAKMTVLVALNERLHAPIPILLLYVNGKYPIEDFSINPFQPDSKESMRIIYTAMVVEEWLDLMGYTVRNP